MLRIKCPKCDKPLGVKDELAGKKVACPKCKAPFTVPKDAAQPVGNGTPATVPVNGAAAPAKSPSERIPFICPACQLKLKIPAELAGRQRSCPKCKTSITIPKLEELKALATTHAGDGSAAGGVDLEDIAASALAGPEAKVEAPTEAEKIDFTCPWCDEQVQFPIDLSGKQEPCPRCKRIVKVPKIERKDPTNWREKQVRGPSLAVGTQQPKLEGAWEGGTTRVSSTALNEADAVPVITEPLPEGTWLRRIVITLLLIGILGGGAFIARNLQLDSRYKLALQAATTSLEQTQSKMPRGWVALANLGAGESKLAIGEVQDARDFFKKARNLFLVNPIEKKEKKDLSPEEEMLLVDVAQLQMQLGGDEELVIHKKKLYWSEVQKELDRTVSGIKSSEGKLLAMRKISLKAMELRGAGSGQLEQDPVAIALGLATQINAGEGDDPDKKSILAAEQVALLIVQKNADLAKKLIEEPELKGTDLPPRVRLAYAQANAYQGNFDEAKKLAAFKVGGSTGVTLSRFQTLVAIADIALAKNKHAEAKECLEEAKKVASEDTFKKAKVPPLLVNQYILLATQLDFAEPWEDWLKRITDPGAKARAQYDVAKHLAKKENKPFELTTIENQKSVAYGQALMNMARQKAQAGSEGEILDMIPSQDETHRPLLYIGVALGTKE